MNTKNILILAGCIILTLGIGSAGAIFTAPEIPNWYASIRKPSFNPPSWVFGPVWTLLYTMMGVSLYLLISGDASGVRKFAITFFIIQFVLNFFWSMIFFRLHETGWALVEIITMWLAIAATIYYGWKVKPLAAYLLIPYLLWVSFASVLNGAIWWLNR